MSNIAQPAPAAPAAPSKLAKRALLAFIIVWFAYQILFPLRHLLYPGSPSWNEEGHRFSWQMKLRDKRNRAVFTVRDPATGTEWDITPYDLLERHQAGKVGSRPDMVLQYANYIAQLFAEQEGIEGVEVRVRVCASLNGRPAQLLYDPEVDLTKIERNLAHADWVMPLVTPFERPPDRERRNDLDC